MSEEEKEESVERETLHRSAKRLKEDGDRGVSMSLSRRGRGGGKCDSLDLVLGLWFPL